MKNPETQIVGVKHVVIHQLFESQENVDVAILKLKHSFNLDTNCIGVADLPQQRIKDWQSCTVLGWGKLYYVSFYDICTSYFYISHKFCFQNGPFANLILQINVTLHSKTYCEPVFMNSKTSKYKICASDRNDYAKNPCLGDSGGPLFCEGNKATCLNYESKILLML